jgi:methylmalonyl-CoA mutase
MSDAVALPPEMSAPARAAWEAAVAKVLKGADPGKLNTITRDGLTLEPLGRVPKGTPALPSWRPPGPWTVVAVIDLPDVAAANAQIHADLAGGADALALVYAGAPAARGFGLPVDTDPARLLDGVAHDLLTIRVEAGAATSEIAARLKRFAPNANVIAADDPLARALVAGDALPAATPGDAVDGRFVHAAGGSEGQELAYVLAALARVWRAAVADGAEPSAALAAIPVTVAADQEQFATIAKLRALRRLIALMAETAGVDPSIAPKIHAETAWRMMAALDVHTNLLRTAVATFAAGVGGADSIAVTPFTAALGLADGFARRLARNTQRVIIDEAQVWRVRDPAAGSGAVEAETAALAEAAWMHFTAMERVGFDAAASDFVADVGRVAEERARDVARRKAPLTGASEFPNLDEATPAVLAPAVVLPAGGLAPHRLAEPFERLRARAAEAAPVAFLAALGTPADFTTRATWAKNVLEAGGIRAPLGDGHDSAEAVASAFQASGASLAVIASSDAVYGATLVPVVEALVAAGAKRLWVAGKPSDAKLETLLKAAGVDGFLFAGQDIAATLAAIQASLGLEG